MDRQSRIHGVRLDPPAARHRLIEYCLKDIEMTQGKIVQCIGAVVDVEFPRNQMPAIFDALKMDAAR